MESWVLLFDEGKMTMMISNMDTALVLMTDVWSYNTASGNYLTKSEVI